MGAASSLLMAGSSAASAISQSQAARMQGDFAREQGEMNAQLANRQANDAVKRGATAAVQARTKTRQFIGQQRAALAANGNDVASGSAAQIQGDSQLMGALDAMTIQNNAYREAWGYQTQATQYDLQGRLSQIGGRAAANQALLTGTLLTGAYGLQAFSGADSTKDPNDGYRRAPSVSSDKYSGWWRNE